MSPVRAWSWVALEAAAIFWVSSLSSPVAAHDDPFFLFLHRWRFDLAFHVLEYGLFGWLAARAFAASPGFPAARVALAAALLGVFYGATDEWHQSFVPLRDPSWTDWAADCAGAIGGAFVWKRFYKGETCRKSVDSAAGATTPQK